MVLEKENSGYNLRVIMVLGNGDRAVIIAIKSQLMNFVRLDMVTKL